MVRRAHYGYRLRTAYVKKTDAHDAFVRQSKRDDRSMRKMRRLQPLKRIRQLRLKEQRRETAAQIGDRLKRSAGESLAEALVAVLIMAFGALMLASMVQSSTRIVLTSNTGMTTVYNAEAEAEKFLGGSNSNPGTGNISDGTVTMTGPSKTSVTKIGGTKLDSSGPGVQIYHDDYSDITAFRTTKQPGG